MEDEIYTCTKCKDTYFLDEGDPELCPRCKVKLVATCDWCNRPESECHCGKDEIILGRNE
jgi:hypothetical protein